MKIRILFVRTSTILNITLSDTFTVSIVSFPIFSPTGIYLLFVATYCFRFLCIWKSPLNYEVNWKRDVLIVLRPTFICMCVTEDLSVYTLRMATKSYQFECAATILHACTQTYSVLFTVLRNISILCFTCMQLYLNGFLFEYFVLSHTFWYNGGFHIDYELHWYCLSWLDLPIAWWPNYHHLFLSRLDWFIHEE